MVDWALMEVEDGALERARELLAKAVKVRQHPLTAALHNARAIYVGPTTIPGERNLLDSPDSVGGVTVKSRSMRSHSDTGTLLIQNLCCRIGGSLPCAGV